MASSVLDQSPPKAPTLVALLVAGAFFMENLDGTVIATAIPKMAESFGATPAALAIGMTAYLVTLAVVIPASGWAADRFGARRVFAAAICVFTLSSMLCGLSNNAWEFTVARVIQGCGGALMTPVGRLVVLRGTAKPDLMRAIATLTWPALVAPVLGPPVGGFITSFSSWRWIFFINLPIGLVGLVATFLLLGREGEAEPRPFDGPGFVLNGFGLGALLFALDEVGRQGTDWVLAGLFIGASVVAGWFAIRHARRAPHPLIPLAAFTVPTFRSTLVGGLLSRVAISTMPFLLPLLFQLGLGMSPFVSGLFVLWYGLTNLSIKPATTPILRRFGFRTVLIGNTLINSAAIAACALIGPATPYWAIVLLLILAGASRSMQFTAINTLAFADMPQTLTTPANTLFNVSFQLSLGLGIALGAIGLRGAEFLLLPPQGSPIVAFRAVFAAVAALKLLALLDFAKLPADAGAIVSGHGAKA